MVLREIKDGTDCSYPPPSAQMVTLQEVGELQGKRHALFEWVPGVTLRETLKAMDAAGNPVPLGLVARVIIDACRALDAVNPARAHGGINDGALQIGFDGTVWVLDWGAPRQTRFRPLGRVNFAADVFAMGGVMHACLTGFAGEYATAPATLPGPSLSHSEATPALDDVVMRALSAQPDQRQRDVGTFADELEAVLAEVLFTHEQLSTVVQTLFKERIKLLQSLGGLTRSDSAPDLEAELPLAGVPMGTQPGIGGPLSIRLDGEAGPEHQSEPTLPRVDSKDLLPIPKPAKPVVPWDSDPSIPPLESAEPTQPRMLSSEAVRAAKVESPPEPDPRERTASVSAADLAAAQDKPRPAVPRRAPPPPPSALETDPGVRDEDTAPRAKPSLLAARPAALDEDTSPRARPSRTAAAALDDLSPRNTTERERLRARGQERIPTPPPDAIPAVLNEPTNVKPRPKPPRDPQQFAQTAQTLTPVMDDDVPDESTEGNGSRGGGLKWMIRVMALLVAALMVGVIIKVKQQQQQKEDEPAVTETEDAGLALEPDDAGPAMAGAELDDAGLDAGAEVDAGLEDAGVADAGAVDAGTLDAGIADAGVAVKKKPPVKKPPKKKKRR